MVRKIFSGIKYFFEGLFKGIALILLVLGLWIPLLYSVTFLLICAVSGIKLSGAAAVFYLVGLAVAGLGSVLFTFLRLKRKKNSSALSYQSQGTLSAVKKKRDIIDRGETANITNDKTVKNSVESNDSKESKLKRQNKERESIQEDAQNSQGVTQADMAYSKKYMIEDMDFLPRGENDSIFESGEKRQTAESEMQSASQTLTLKSEKEAPKIFRLRSDPTIRAYDYSDRVEFYRHTRQGWVFHDVKKK